jgi:hypothetical protein
MRPPMLVSLAIIVPLAGAFALRSVTGDMMSAVIVALTLTVTAIACLAGPSRVSRASRRS